MARTAKKTKEQEPLEKTLWKSADKLRKNMDAAEYKHVVLGLIFLKYISDAFEELHTKLAAGEGEEYKEADPEDADEYRAENVFFVPSNARWSYLQACAKLPEIGKDVDEAMETIEKENPTLKGVLPKQYARQNLDKASLGALIDLIATVGLGDARAQAQDVPGRVYEYFLGKFAAAEGKKGSQFYTPANRQTAGQHAGALQGSSLRPLLRFRRHIRAGGEAGRGPPGPHRRSLSTDRSPTRPFTACAA